MRAVSPVIPEANEAEKVYAEDQSAYQPLPTIKRADGIILTRWLLSEEERRQVAEQGYFYLAVITNNEPLQPLKLTAVVPPEFEYQPMNEEWPTEIDA